MNELAKAVLVLVLSTAAAVWLMGAALHLWPSADQLAYGNPLPYLKVKFDRPANAVRFWVEDFGGLPYERVWLYVNGRLAASGGPGTDAAAKCGDEVAAVVKYHSGVKKLEGRILCTNPIRTPQREVPMEFYHFRTAEAVRALTGDMDVTGAPIFFRGICYDNFDIEIRILPTRPDVLVGLNNDLGLGGYLYYKWDPDPYTNRWWSGPYIYKQEGTKQYGNYYYYTYARVPLEVFKIPDGAGSQFLGGRRYVLDIKLELDAYTDSDGAIYAYYWYAYVNGSQVAKCIKYVYSYSYRYAYNVTKYKDPQVVGKLTNTVYINGTVYSGTLLIYQNPDNTIGFRYVANPIDGANPEPPYSSLVSGKSTTVEYNTPSGPAYVVWSTDYYILQGLLANTDFSKLLNYIESYPNAKTAFAVALAAMGGEFNVKPQEYQETRYGYRRVTWYKIYRYNETVGMTVTLLNPTFLGAVYATTIVPIPIKLPPVAKPQINMVVGYSSNSTVPTTTSNSNKPIFRDAIIIYPVEES
jgi:hypothetical protein